MAVNRRQFIALAGCAGLGTLAYSYYRGMRMPPLVWEPPATAASFSLAKIDISGSNVIRTHQGVVDNTEISFRAYAPEPLLQLQAKAKDSLRISINNIATDARLQLDGKDVAAGKRIAETTHGISRIVELAIDDAEAIVLSWKLPELKSYKFAAIGDSGGGQELAWCISRAHELGARFLLHLGDFNYQPGDYASAIRLFNQAPLPCYVSIGNHDFHERGALYHSFLDDIGPLNHHFAIGNTRFANIDTAANILPYAGGHRGKLMRELIAAGDHYTTTVAFTHRPLYDPDPQEAGDHDIGSAGERDWLIRAMKQANISTLLSGHIHIHNQREVGGINNIIVGQGLGHQDLITNRDYSKMLLGQVSEDGQVDYQFAPLAMPMEMHCHPRSDAVKQSLLDAPHADVIRAIDLACGKT